MPIYYCTSVSVLLPASNSFLHAHVHNITGEYCPVTTNLAQKRTVQCPKLQTDTSFIVIRNVREREREILASRQAGVVERERW